MNRRGISPLIATVLLFAFAVALSTMVISYVLKATKSTPCDDVAVGVDGIQEACYSDGHIHMILVNKGQVPLTGAKVRIQASNRDIQEVQLANALAPGSASSVDITYQTLNPAGVTLTLVPIINRDGELYCVEQETRVPLRMC
jgi:flagellin-like protein